MDTDYSAWARSQFIYFHIFETTYAQFAPSIFNLD